MPGRLPAEAENGRKRPSLHGNKNANLGERHTHGRFFGQDYLAEASAVLQRLDGDAIERMVELLAETRTTRAVDCSFSAVGGSAANASHAVNDFRKIAGIEAYAPTDNVSELTARTNDEGWASVFEDWLRVSRLAIGPAAGPFRGRRQPREERQP